jgi:hypothetical protein
MRPPAIRYPLPTLVLVLLLGLVAWRGEALTRPLRAALAERWKREIKGPDYPRSDHPQVIAGPITRKGLLLHDETAVSEAPVAPPTRSIRLRMFVEVFDLWPLRGEPTHYRVGNREPIGWVEAKNLLPWSTRLAVHAPAGTLPLSDHPGDAPTPTPVDRATLPVSDWSAEAIELAVWEPDQPWTRISRRGWVRLDDLPAEAWGVWLSREELLALLRRSLDTSKGPSPEITRLRAVLGRLLDDRPLTESDLATARDALPKPVFARRATASGDVSESLARINEQWSAEASWGGLAFQFIPLSTLP